MNRYLLTLALLLVWVNPVHSGEQTLRDTVNVSDTNYQISAGSGDMSFKDPNAGTHTLSDLVGGGSSTNAQHVVEVLIVKDDFVPKDPKAENIRFATTTNTHTLTAFAFDDDVQEYLVRQISLPENLDTTKDVTFTFYWTPETAPGAETFVRWNVDFVSKGDGDSLDVVALTNAVGTDGSGTTQDALRKFDLVKSSPGLTAGGILIMHISRVATDGSDTLVDDARLMSMKVTMEVTQ